MKAIEQLINRTIGEQWIDRFEITIEDRGTETDYFELSTEGEKVKVIASSTLGAIGGVNWYLKHYLNVHISWCGDQKKIENEWPTIEEKIYKQTPYKYKYYLNYCTFGYSMCFWDWERWEQELDWMALNGVNVALSLVGHEEVWRQTLMAFGYSNEEAKAFICGLAFLPWQWMQNIEGWGSDHTDEWFDRRVELANKIHNRMKELGIMPAMQGYSGMLPNGFKEKYPEVQVIGQGKWCNLTRPDLLMPGTEWFDRVADMFYNKQKEILDVDTHFYCTDPFHEGGSSQGMNVTDCIKIIQDKMIQWDKDAIWIIQGWGGNPGEDTLNGLDKSHSLVLDLWCEASPTWNTKEAFKGMPWVWCVLGNFGGKNALYGNLEATATGHLETKHHPDSGQMVGVGMTMEGIDNNPIVWDLLCDSSWERTPIDLQEWIKDYITRRYGAFSQTAYDAWMYLKNSIYNCTRRQEGGVESVFCGRPRLDIDSVSTWGPKDYYYDIEDVQKALKLLVKDYAILAKSEAFRYDAVDVARQVLADIGKGQYSKWVEAYHNRDHEAFTRESKLFLEMIQDMENLLATQDGFLLGTYLEEAKNLGHTAEEKAYMEWNARTIITLWADEEGSKPLRDYSHRQWAGLMGDFYLKRWERYFDAIEATWETGEEPAIDWYSIEYAWTTANNVYPTETQGVAQQVIESIIEKYLGK